MTFDSVERSIQDACPVELYEFTTPLKTFRITDYETDLTFNNNLYTSVTGARSNVAVVDFATDQTDVSVQLPPSHELVQRYSAGIPMRDLLVTITRAHLPSFVATQYWQGYSSGLSYGNRMASFRVPSGTNDALALDMPSVCAQRTCNHTLYDAQCTINRNLFLYVQTLQSISPDGRTLVMTTNLPPTARVTDDPWTKYGEVLHVASQERRTIIDQPALNTIVLQVAYPNGSITVGDTLWVYAGCNHGTFMCKDKFNNAVNYGGFPWMLPSNIFYVGLNVSQYKPKT